MIEDSEWDETDVTEKEKQFFKIWPEKNSMSMARNSISMA